ncbi:MAG: asparagine synthase (glutamine-hydrolyzing) [Chitinivibrionales bacterium]|nr:asparagine synthase (glutamine-hydrolyzing) [Chitinivibrionales bacterium]
MCGITGIFHHATTSPIPIESLKKMVAILKHRGPDESGIYIDDHVGLGHTRLSIIDLSGGKQPLSNEDGRYWIVFNGEIFNYVELITELEKRGHHFATRSDTEVIVHLYEELGIDCVSQLNGQFAFAIWDRREKELFLARDRVGIRPLQYAIAGGAFVFSSEIKSIMLAPSVNRQIDPIGLDQTFTFWTTLPGRTIFKDIYELKPGCSLLVSSAGIRQQTYWTIPYVPRNLHVHDSPQELTEKVRALFTDAVRIQMRADVPVGAYLSGGLDSSGITTIIARQFNSAVNTFAVRFEESAFDEGQHQSVMADFLKVNHMQITATNDLIAETFPDVVWHCERPLLRTAPVPLFLLSKFVRQHNIKVVLTGEGADEVFGGYNIFREALIRAFCGRQPQSAIRPGLFRQLYPNIFKDSRSKETLKSFFGQQLNEADSPLFSHMIRWSNTARIKTFFSEWMQQSVKSYDGYQEVIESLPSDFSNRDTLAKAQYLETMIFLSNYLLSSQGDRVAMAHSLEIRVPYLDHRLIEFMAAVPPVWKILGLNEKHLLKKVFSGIIPESILQRTKHPYRAPIQQTFFGPHRPEYVNDVLSDDALHNTNLFDGKKVNLLRKRIASSPVVSEVDGMAVAGIISMQLVYQKYIDHFPSDQIPAQNPTLCIDKRSN